MNLADQWGDEAACPAELYELWQGQTFGRFTFGVGNGADTKYGTRAVIVLPGVKPDVDHKR